MDKQLISTLKSQFDTMAHFDQETGIEFWSAREMMAVLGYTRWENFFKAIQRATESCKTASIPLENHFREIKKMVTLGSDSQRLINDYELTRYACYLIAQNGDPSKPEIAFAQSYFALQTRKQELIEDRINLLHRLEVRSS